MALQGSYSGFSLAAVAASGLDVLGGAQQKSQEIPESQLQIVGGRML